MRLYTGISLTQEVEANLTTLLEDLRPIADLKWSPVENLHITTKFIGEWPPSRLAELNAALSELAADSVSPSICLRGFDWFPDSYHPKALAISVESNLRLTGLASATATALETLGLPQEARPYKPHLTLARIPDRAQPGIRNLQAHLAPMTDFDFGSFRATEFHLYLSTPGPQASVYRKLASFPLGNPPLEPRA
jgi:2'-5' RNA ligase